MPRPVCETDAQRFGRIPSGTGSIARLACIRAKEAGIDVDPLLKKAGMTWPQIEDRDAPIKVQSQVKFLKLVAAALPDDFLGFHLAVEYDLREIGLLHYTLASSETLGDALERAARYSMIVNEGIAIRYIEANDLTILFEYVGVARHSDVHQIEFWIAAVIRNCRELTGRRLMPLHVHVAHPRHEDHSEFDAFAGSEVEFGAARDAIVFPRSIVALPVISADRFLNDMLVGYCEQALARRAPGAAPLRTAVENAIAPLLPHGKARLGEIARKLGISQRTLTRRLASEGLSFGGVLDDLRSDLAQRHIRDSGLSISQIAWLLGYQEISGFTHAFKRWTGVTPSVMRLQHEAGSE